MTRELHLIVHVPKCAGRTIERHLLEHLGRERFWLPPKRTRRVPLELFGRKYDPVFAGRLEDVDAISGHFFGKSIEAKFPDRKIVRSIILRQPEKQLLSWYNFRMMRYISQGLHPFPLSLFVRSLPVDPVAYFLLERWFELPWIRIAALTARQKVDMIDAALATFDRVVDIEEADELCSWHSEALGVPTRAMRVNTSEQWSAETGWEPLKISQLSDADRKLLESRSAIDRYLWKKWALKEEVTFDRPAGSDFVRNELVRPFLQIRQRASRQFGWEL